MSISHSVDIVISFYALLLISACVLLATIVSGRLGLRRLHFTFVVCLVASLLITIVLAYQLNNYFDFPAKRHAIHMPLARLAFLALFGPLITGVQFWRGKWPRKAHRLAVVVFCVAMAAALLTGIWMMMGRSAKLV